MQQQLSYVYVQYPYVIIVLLPRIIRTKNNLNLGRSQLSYARGNQFLTIHPYIIMAASIIRNKKLKYYLYDTKLT